MFSLYSMMYSTAFDLDPRSKDLNFENKTHTIVETFIDAVQLIDIFLTFFTAVKVRDLSYFTRRLRKKHIKKKDED